MQLAQKLKEEGNACFCSGDVDGAAVVYRQAIDLLTQTKGNQKEEEEEEVERERDETKDKLHTMTDDVRGLLAVLYSNLSNVFHVQGRHDDSWRAAEQATFYNPFFPKAWLRYVHNRRLAGYPFEAFVALLRYLRPLLRSPASASTPAILASDITAEEISLCGDLGLSRVLSHIELEEYEGGVGIVARKAIKPDEVILVEKRFDTFLGELDLGAQNDLTTMKMVSYFAHKIFLHQRDLSEEWVHVKKQFKGCWPRRSEDISDHTRSKLTHTLRAQFPDMSDADFEELFAFSLMCRSNCFRNGFFRACALANHSCYANAAMKFNPKDGTVTLIAVRFIDAGEFINVKYISDAQFVMGVGNRREYLYSWIFWCVCDRCRMDNESSATQEQIECRRCGKYTHLPLTNERAELEEKDPLLAREKPCTHCGEIVTWSPESRTVVLQLMESFMSVTTYSTYDQIIAWLLHCLRQIMELRVHPDHWLYRGLFYYFCISMKSILDEAFAQFSSMGCSSPLVRTLLRDVGVRRLYEKLTCRAAGPRAGSDDGEEEEEGEGAGGGDVLYVLRVLWRLISPFYPENEAWAVHRAICHLVLFSHTAESGPAALSDSQALDLLRRHGRWIGGADASLWMHAYNRFRQNTRRNGLLSMKQIKNALQP